MWSLTQMARPVNPVVSLEDAKLHLRVEHVAEDSLIVRIINAATERCEVFQLRSYVTRTYRLTLPRLPRNGRIIHLPRPPVQSVESIVYLDQDGDEQTIAVNDYRLLDDGRVYLSMDSWPRTGNDPDAVRITYVAGYGDEGDDVPEAARAAVLLLAGHLYENREAVTVGTGPTFALPMSVEYLLYPYRAFERDPLGGC